MDAETETKGHEYIDSKYSQPLLTSPPGSFPCYSAFEAPAIITGADLELHES